MTGLGGVVGVPGTSTRISGAGSGGGWKVWKNIEKIVRAYEERVIPAYQRYQKLQKTIGELKQAASELNGNLALAAVASLKVKDEERIEKVRKAITSFESKAAEFMRHLVRKNPKMAETLYRLLREIEKEYGIQTLPTMIYEVMRIRAYRNFRRCQECARNARRNWKFRYYNLPEVCERSKVTYDINKLLKNYKIVPEVRIRFLREKFDVDDPWNSRVEREISEFRINGKIAEKAEELGLYCNRVPLDIEHFIFPWDGEPLIPEKTADHFPQDITAEVKENGEFERVWISRKHGSEGEE